MSEFDIKCMRQAMDWAAGCKPIKDSIPKVGAVIAIGERVIGRGRRRTGEDDDQHAEWHALREVIDKTKLPEATLYTTLEPCTRDVRTKGLESCTELIHQHKIKRVFIGILDPNQGVTGKGLWRLQDSGVGVTLFPHNLGQEIRSMNAPFIRSHRTLGATIISPRNGDVLKTYETQGKHPIRFNASIHPEQTITCFPSAKASAGRNPAPSAKWGKGYGRSTLTSAQQGSTRSIS
jgi:pyrimidine deaminase RibD-like protein